MVNSQEQVNLAEGVNLNYLKKRKIDDVLVFMQEGQKVHYKIVRIDKKKNEYWAKVITLFDEDANGSLSIRK